MRKIIEVLLCLLLVVSTSEPIYAAYSIRDTKIPETITSDGTVLWERAKETEEQFPDELAKITDQVLLYIENRTGEAPVLEYHISDIYYLDGDVTKNSMGRFFQSEETGTVYIDRVIASRGDYATKAALITHELLHHYSADEVLTETAARLILEDMKVQYYGFYRHSSKDYKCYYTKEVNRLLTKLKQKGIDHDTFIQVFLENPDGLREQFEL